MKNLYLLLLFFVLSTSATSAQCVIDSTDTALITPSIGNIPCIDSAIAYNQVLQFNVPASYSFTYMNLPITVTIDSMVIDSVTGFPTGITETMMPANGVVYGGGRACSLLSGTTYDTTGTYPLIFYGFVHAHYLFIDTTIQLSTLTGAGQVYVIHPGDSCPPQVPVSGIRNFNSTLNTEIKVYPNPNNGNFELQLNPGGRLQGDVVIMDITGRIVFKRELDIMGLYNTSIDISKFSKGLYTLQIRTASGFASRNISVE